jgi:hypothetical protein
MGQRVLAQRDLDLHAGIGVVAQHLHHARHRLRVLGRLRDDFHRHDLSGFGLPAILRRHDELVADALVFGRNEEHPVLAVQTAD